MKPERERRARNSEGGGMPRRGVAIVLCALMGAPGAAPGADTRPAVVEGDVTLDRRPLPATGVAFVDLQTGAVRRTFTDARGAFRAELPAGAYAVAAEGRPDLALSRAPSPLNVAPGAAVMARLEMQAVPGAAPPPLPATAAAARPLIEHRPVGCLVVRRCAQVQAGIRATPPGPRARTYFRPEPGSAWYYQDMARDPAAGGDFVATLPAPLQPGVLRYYVSAVSPDGSEQRSPEVLVRVVEDPAQCGDGIVPPPAAAGAATILAAGSGAEVQPEEFGSCDETAAPPRVASRPVSKRLIALLAGAAAAGIGLTIALNDEPATPSR
jgi:hypothetical protein